MRQVVTIPKNLSAICINFTNTFIKEFWFCDFFLLLLIVFAFGIYLFSLDLLFFFVYKY